MKYKITGMFALCFLLLGCVNNEPASERERKKAKERQEIYFDNLHQRESCNALKRTCMAPDFYDESISIRGELRCECERFKNSEDN